MLLDIDVKGSMNIIEEFEEDTISIFVEPPGFNNEEKIYQSYDVKNIHRAVGTRLSHYIYKEFNKKKLPEDFISIDFFGSAGQSFGAFGINGLTLKLFGDANDYVGKGLSGAKLVILPPKESTLKSGADPICEAGDRRACETQLLTVPRTSPSPDPSSPPAARRDPSVHWPPTRVPWRTPTAPSRRQPPRRRTSPRRFPETPRR